MKNHVMQSPLLHKTVLALLIGTAVSQAALAQTTQNNLQELATAEVSAEEALNTKANTQQSQRLQATELQQQQAQ